MDLENLGHIAEQAAIAAKNFHIALYKCFNKDYTELIKVADPTDLKENEHFFFEIPDEHNTEFINLVIVGCTMKQAFEILKETYKF